MDPMVVVCVWNFPLQSKDMQLYEASIVYDGVSVCLCYLMAWPSFWGLLPWASGPYKRLEVGRMLRYDHMP